MSNHVNIEVDERVVPYYAVHDDGKVFGFFGAFSFLSNFYPCPIGMGELVFPSTEHAYQSFKYPEHQRRQFVDITASQSKQLGKLAPNFNAKKWNKIKYDLMYQLNWTKYYNNPILKEKLLLTDGCILEERNSWKDLDWGTNERGEGENNLGKILMRVRDKMIAIRDKSEW